jgi:hypothetical protein
MNLRLSIYNPMSPALAWWADTRQAIPLYPTSADSMMAAPVPLNQNTSGSVGQLRCAPAYLEGLSNLLALLEAMAVHAQLQACYEFPATGCFGVWDFASKQTFSNFALRHG